MTFYINTTGGMGSIVFPDTSAGTMSTAHSIFETASGTQAKIVVKKTEISPKLYLNYVKSKLKALETAEVKRRLKHLPLLIEGAVQCGQAGLREQLERQLLVLIKDQEAAACGYNKFVLIEDIERFKGKVRDRTIGFCKLDNYSRSIPAAVREVIKEVKSKEIFDEFWVLYNDLTKDGPLKTTKEKIREKDPILFGKYSYDSQRYFFITDWVDKYCDLTFDKFVGELKKEKVGEEYLVGEVKDLTPDDVLTIKAKLLQRKEALEQTNSSN